MEFERQLPAEKQFTKTARRESRMPQFLKLELEEMQHFLALKKKTEFFLVMKRGGLWSRYKKHKVTISEDGILHYDENGELDLKKASLSVKVEGCKAGDKGKYTHKVFKFEVGKETHLFKISVENAK